MAFIYPGGDAQVTTNLGLATWGMDEVLAENMILIDAAVGSGGTSVEVNGVTISNPNFNDSTPAAPAGKVNVTWQVLGGSVSAYGNAGTVTSVDIAAPAEFIVGGSPITTSGTISLTKATQTANTVWAGPTTGAAAQPTFRALVSADLPSGTGTVTSVAMTGDGVIFNSTVSGSPITTTGTLVPALLTQTANTFLAGPTSGGAATPTFRAIGSSDIPTGTVLWNQIGSATGALTLSNGTNNTTFNHTSATTWTWANTAPTVPNGLVLSAAANASGGNTQYTGTITGGGTNNYAGALVTIAGFVGANNNGLFTVISNTTTTITVNNPAGTSETHAGTVSGAISGSSLASSPILTLAGTYSTASASQTDTWTIQSTPTVAGNNGTIALNILHTGSTGTKTVNLGVAGSQSVGLALFGSTSGGITMTASATGGSLNVANNAGGALTINGVSGLILGGSGSAQVALATTVDLKPAGISTFTVTSGTGVTKFTNINTTGSGVPAQFASVALTAQSAAVGTTVLYAVPATGAGLYRIVFYSKITTAATTSSVLGGTNGFQITFTDPTDSTTPTMTAADLVTNALNANTTTTTAVGEVFINAKASTNISYAYDYTSVGVTAMQYKLNIKLEYMGA